MLSLRPSSRAAPSTWKLAVAEPQRKSSGNEVLDMLRSWNAVLLKIRSNSVTHYSRDAGQASILNHPETEEEGFDG